MTLIVHRAERADALVHALADVLATPLDDPLATEIVAVHSRGIERWLSQELSLRLGVGALGDDGVVANLAFPFPSRLVGDVLRAVGAGDPDRDPWAPARLTWPLLQLVEAGDDPDTLGPLLGVGADPDDPERLARRFGAVRHVADLFDRYAVHRPAMIRAWARGEPVGADLSRELSDDHRWQQRLWRRVRRDLPPSPAERFADAVGALRGGGDDLLDLPPRLSLFGLTALPVSYVEVLDALARRRDVHLFLLHPSADLWDRVAAVGRDGALPLRAADPTRDAPRHPLLASWARDARELQLVLGAATDAPREHRRRRDDGADPPTPSATLLRRLQGQIRRDTRLPRPGGDPDAPLPALDAADRSLQVHACHGRLRQVEALRDAVLGLLVADPTLQPRDAIVLCPDIEAFAPLVTAVFGAGDPTSTAPDGAGGVGLRVRLADRSIRRVNPVLDVVAALLDMPDSRAPASAVLDLLARAPVRRRFRLDDDDLATVERWIDELEIRWGLDDEHRARHGLAGVRANTWQAGLERLGLGVAMADEDARLIAGAVPFDEVEGQAVDLAGRVTEFVERLGRAMRRLVQPRSVASWRDELSRATDELTATSPSERWQRLQLHRVLDDLVDESTPDGDPARSVGVELTLPELRRLLDGRLVGRPTRTGHRTGDLTVCTLVPMRSVPHRVVCVLGLDDDAFPRRNVTDADDLLAASPRVGDRDPRSEDRQLLLDAFLAAGDHVVITYTGRDGRTNERRPPAVPLDELLDVVDRTVTAEGHERARHAVTVDHPLQSFDPRSFLVDDVDGPRSFDAGALAAARAVVAEPTDPPPFADPQGLPARSSDSIELDDLVAFLQHPVKAFCTQRLDVRLPSSRDVRDDTLLTELTSLDRYAVGEALVQGWRRGEPRNRTLEVLRARGRLPPGALADAELPGVLETVERLLGLCEDQGVTNERTRTVDVEVELADGRLVVGTVPNAASDRWQVADVGFATVRAKHRLAAWVRHVAVTSCRPEHPWRHVLIGKGSRGRVVAHRYRELGADRDERAKHALAELQRLVELRDLGLTRPLPLYTETSFKCAENLHRDRPADTWVDSRWETDPYRGFEQEDADPYHELVLGGRPTFEELWDEACRPEETWAEHEPRLAAWAWRLWGPILTAPGGTATR